MKYKNKILVFDIETIPNIMAGRNLLSLDDTVEDSEVAKLLTDYHINISSTGNDFLRQPFHKIACISYLNADIVNDNGIKWYKAHNIRTAGNIDSTELEILMNFNKYCEKETPKLVTFNGKMFDLPVIKYRSMYYKIPMKWYYNLEELAKDKWYQSYDNRYSQDNIDLFDTFSSGRGSVKMAEVCATFGVPCKIDADGSGVYEMVLSGKLEKVRNYCETDALVTFVLFAIYSSHTGAIEFDGYVKTIKHLFQYIKETNAPHLLEWLDLCKNSPLLCDFINI